MIHQPSKRELQKLEKLNKAYKKISQALKDIKNIVPKDEDIALRIYRIEKEHEKICKRMQVVLERQYVDSEFKKIVSGNKKKKKK